MKKVELSGRTFIIPDFVREYGHNNDSPNPLLHEFHGSFLRHRTIERVLVFLRHTIVAWMFGDVECFLKRFANLFLDLLFGLNCNFPLKDIVIYMVWRLKKDCVYPCY